MTGIHFKGACTGTVYLLGRAVRDLLRSGLAVHSPVGRGRHQGSGSLAAQLPGLRGPVVRPPYSRLGVGIFVKTAVVFPYCCMVLS